MKPVAIIDRGRGPELAGTRITIYNLVPYILAGWHYEKIAGLYRISPADVLAMMDYFEQHKDDVLAVHAKIEARNAKGNPPEVEAIRAKGKAKLQALRAELERKRQTEGNGEGHHLRR